MAGVAFPGAEVVLDFLDPGGDGTLLPSGRTTDRLAVPGLGEIRATLLNAGNPTIFTRAADLGLTGCENRAEFNRDAALLHRCEAIRAQGAVAMGLAASAEDATARRPHTPNWLSSPRPETTAPPTARRSLPPMSIWSLGILSMGASHHAFTGTGAVALVVAAVLPGTLVHELLGGRLASGDEVRIGHAVGVMAVSASVVETGGRWRAEKVVLCRSAWRLMEGWVLVPDSALVPPENRSNRVQLVGYFLLILRSSYQPPVFTGAALSVIIPTRRVIHSFCG